MSNEGTIKRAGKKARMQRMREKMPFQPPVKGLVTYTMPVISHTLVMNKLVVARRVSKQ